MSGLSLHHDAPRPSAPERNAVLRELGPAAYGRIASRLEEVSLQAGEILVDADERAEYVYFPQTGVVSLVANFRDGGTVEVGTIGCEGVVGIWTFLHSETTPFRTMVQTQAVLRRLPRAEFERALAEFPVLDRMMRHYVDAYLFHVSQNAACNRMHDLGQRAARWLLLTHDRVGSDTFALTHEFLAMMLGVRRAGVSEAAAELQRRGAIRYTRGRVSVVDRALLEQASCECYAAIRERFDAVPRTVSQAAAAD